MKRYYVGELGSDSYSGRSSRAWAFLNPSGTIEVDESGNLILLGVDIADDLPPAESLLWLKGSDWAGMFEVASGAGPNSVNITLVSIDYGTFSPVPETLINLYTGFGGDGPFATLAHALEALVAGDDGDVIEDTVPSNVSAYVGGSAPRKLQFAFAGVSAPNYSGLQQSLTITRQAMDGLPANPRLAVFASL